MTMNLGKSFKILEREDEQMVIELFDKNGKHIGFDLIKSKYLDYRLDAIRNLGISEV